MTWGEGMVSPMSQLRITRSLVRTMPASPATTNTHAGVSVPVRARSISRRAKTA